VSRSSALASKATSYPIARVTEVPKLRCSGCALASAPATRVPVNEPRKYVSVKDGKRGRADKPYGERDVHDARSNWVA
jgi:carbamoylphosphate synthase large subunit